MTADELTRTGVLRIRRTWRDRWRNALKPRPAATPEPEMVRIQLDPPDPPQEAAVDGHIYVSNEPEPGEHTTALGRHRVEKAVQQPPVPRELSLEQATRRIPVLERTLASLGMRPAEALIYEQLAGQWHSGTADDQVCSRCGLKAWDADDLQPGDDVCVCDQPFGEGPATDHRGDAVRLPVLDQEGGESRD